MVQQRGLQVRGELPHMTAASPLAALVFGDCAQAALIFKSPSTREGGALNFQTQTCTHAHTRTQSWGDEDIPPVLEYMSDALKKGVTTMSSFEKYKKEVRRISHCKSRLRARGIGGTAHLTQI